MARPHIEFVQSQALPWRTLPDTAARPGAEVKVLSRDGGSGAVSVILRYPAGWEIGDAHALDTDEEFFVLAGELAIGDIAYSRHDYAYLPAGYPRASMRVAAGADVLTFFPGPHKNVFGQDQDTDASALIERAATADMPWGGDVDPNVVGAGLGKKVLRLDAATGERTWLLTMGVNDPATVREMRLETHPHVEEMLLLDGAISMPGGVLRQGAYFWRPGGLQHGPTGTLPGCTCFFRCMGGPFATEWSDEAHTILWDAPDSPIVQDDLAGLAKAGWPATEAY
jgi:hypothetical protein